MSAGAQVRAGDPAGTPRRWPEQLRILMVMDAPYPAFGWCCQRVFESMGHRTMLVDAKRNHLPVPGETVWDYGRTAHRLRVPRVNDAIANAEVRRAAKAFQPDLILLGKCENLSIRTLRCLRRHTPAVLINWNLDNPFHPLNTSLALLRSFPLLDCYGSFARNLVPAVESLGCPRVEHWPCYFYPDLHRADLELTAGDRERFGCDVVFAGGWSAEREAMLTTIADQDLAIWGPGWDRLDASSPLKPRYRGARVVGDDYVRALRGAACVINVLNQQGRGANNLRTFEATGLGCFLLTEWSPEHAGDLFAEDEELVCFSDPAELKSKLLHYLRRPDERQAIARRGQARTLRDHTLTKRLEAVLAVAAEAAARRRAEDPALDTARR